MLLSEYFLPLSSSGRTAFTPVVVGRARRLLARPRDGAAEGRSQDLPDFGLYGH
jgi:hypothetical protein